MSTSPSSRAMLYDVISDMEPAVRDLVRWGQIVGSLGTSDHVHRESLVVVGHAIVELAETIVADWERCHEFASLSRGSKPCA